MRPVPFAATGPGEDGGDGGVDVVMVDEGVEEACGDLAWTVMARIDGDVEVVAKLGRLSERRRGLPAGVSAGEAPGGP